MLQRLEEIYRHHTFREVVLLLTDGCRQCQKCDRTRIIWMATKWTNTMEHLLEGKYSTLSFRKSRDSGIVWRLQYTLPSSFHQPITALIGSTGKRAVENFRCLVQPNFREHRWLDSEPPIAQQPRARPCDQNQFDDLRLHRLNPLLSSWYQHTSTGP